MPLHRTKFSWKCLVAFMAIGAASIALPARSSVAQSSGEKDNNPSIDDDEARADAVKLHEKVLLATPETPPSPPTQPSYPRKPAQAESGDKADDPFGAHGKVEAAQQKARALQEVMKALKQQQEQMSKQQALLGKQLEELSKGTGGPPQSFEWNFRPEQQKRLEYAQALAGANNINDASGAPVKIVAPLPPNAVLRAFKLQYVKPEDIGQALHNITGGGGPRIAIDERTNTLVIAGEDKQMGVVQQVIETLDQPSGPKGKGNDTLQVRVVWVLDAAGKEGKPAEPPYVSKDVVEGLSELGFESPRVMCQQLTSLTFGREREGNFQFHIPVLAEGSSWQFTGDGRIRPANDDRYSIDFTLGLQQPNNTNNCQVGGSILTPLAHYTVMGTSTFVAGPPEVESDAVQNLKQHLSAFVIYLDRVPEFGETESGGKKK
jgi:hypothetical protein